ncbi:hypothetical protein [Azospirillum largimobile]
MRGWSVGFGCPLPIPPPLRGRGGRTFAGLRSGGSSLSRVSGGGLGRGPSFPKTPSPHAKSG